MEEPGAHDTASDTDNENFCDASEGRPSVSRPQSRAPSPPVSPLQVETAVSSTDTAIPGSAVTATPDSRQITAENGTIQEESVSITRPNTESPKRKIRSKSILNSAGSGHPSQNNDTDDQFGEDFDDFEVGVDDGGNDDFSDFNDTFEGPASGADVSQEAPPDIPGAQSPEGNLPPLLNFDAIKSLPDLLSATTDHLNTMFPNVSNLSSLPKVDPIPNDSAIFMTERSLSLWSQLVAPPPLQPPNWTRSRIRRLFLVSLGVPVDLDEILPASKQKKLVLPSMDLEGNKRTAAVSSATDAANRSPSRPKKDGQQRSSRSLDAKRPSSEAQVPKRRGQEPPPELDLSAASRLCATTDAALDGFTDQELRDHVAHLERMSTRAGEVLQYWSKRRDAQRAEKEAFEGVIENLVRHARQVRK